MHYTNAVLVEGCRIVFFVYLGLPHHALADVKVGEYAIPKGATVMPSLMHVMLDPEYFPYPHAFSPDQLIDERGSFEHGERVIPFGIGKRYCPGQSLEAKDLT